MPLTETEWGLVTGWVRDHLLDTPEPRERLLDAGLPADFVEDLPLTPDAARNALLVVEAARRDLAHQRRLLAVLTSLDALAAIDDPYAHAPGTEARTLLTRLRDDERLLRSPRDPFLSTLLKHGTEAFLDRAELREKLRSFTADAERPVLVVDGPPDSGRSYTYEFIRHLGQHCGFRPVRVTLSRTTTANRLVERLAAFVAGPGHDDIPLNPTRLNDPLPAYEDAVHRVVARAAASGERFWLVLDDCDRLDPGSDTWDCIGILARAVYEHAPVRSGTAPRLVLLGYATERRQLPYEVRKIEYRDTTRQLDEGDLRSFFDEFFAEECAPADGDAVRELTDTAVSEVLRAAEARDPQDSWSRRVCTAVEDVVRLHRVFRAAPPGPGSPGDPPDGGDTRAGDGRPGTGLAPAASGQPLRDALRTGLAAPAPPVSEPRRAYRESACLLQEFDPELLRRPGEERATGQAVLELVDDCVALPSAGAAVWTLKPDVRDAALAGLAGPEAALRALLAGLGPRPAGTAPAPGTDGCPGPHPGPERFALALLTGVGLPPPRDGDGEDVEELSDVLQAVLWLRRIPGVPGLPPVDAVQRRLERARLFQPLRRLVPGSFHGRAAELDALRAYIDLPEEPAEPPVLLHGVGGVGKSTLLAKFLLDALDEAGAASFPFAYIDFARPTLSLHEPATLLAETARQLGVQYPDHRPAFDALADACERTAASQRDEREEADALRRLSTTRATYGRDYSADLHARASAREQDLARRLATLVGTATGSGTAAGGPGSPARDRQPPPFVIVVDSFEEAQYRGSPVVTRMWAVWSALRASYARLRFIVSGRALIDHPARILTPRSHELTELDRESAVALLVSSGVRDETVAAHLVDRVGGHPLSLRLAARTAVALGGDSGALGEVLRTLPSRRRYFDRQVDQMLIQGTLYDRILHHIAEDDVRALVQAGLALRSLTPDLIREVLAEPAGTRVESAGEARRLFGLLTSRVDLMEPAGPGAVRHRTDLRAIMLRLSDSARTDLMRAVDRRAVAYYAAREGPRARAEEIYHRLRLGENPRTVEARWEPGVAGYLGGSTHTEMPPRSAAFLLARIGGHVPDRIMAEAAQEDWERIAAREVEDLLTQGYVEAAAERLAERRPWTPCSRLHSLLAETLARSGRPDRARESAERAVDGAAEAGCAETRLELLQLSARLAQDAGDLAGADRALREAEEVADGLGLRSESLGVLVARSRLADLAGTGAPAAREQLARSLRAMPDEELARQPSLARTAAASACPADPRLLEHTLRLVGLPADQDAVVTELARWIDATMDDEPALRAPLARILRSAAAPEPDGPAPPVYGGGEPPAAGEEVPYVPGPDTGDGTLDGVPYGPGEGVPYGGGPGSRTPPAAPGAAARMAEEEIGRCLRQARHRGTLDTVARRALALRDDSGDLLRGIAAAMAAGAGGRAGSPGAGRRAGTGRWTQPPPHAAEAAVRSEPYLPAEELVRVRNAVMESGLAGHLMRAVLLKGMPVSFTATLEPFSDPREQTDADLAAMNRIERLMTGLVPLEVWLHNASEKAREPGPRAVLEGALDAVARMTAGEAELPAEMMPAEIKEEIIFQDDTVPYAFLQHGIRAGASVALLKIPPYEGGAPLLPSYPHGGTGWIVAPGLLMTNHHVVMARSWESGVRPHVTEEDLRLQAVMSRSRFDFVENMVNPPEVTAGELAAWDAGLDYAVVRLAEGQPERPMLRIATRPLLVRQRQRVPVNIIQHPGGLPKRVALRNNLVYRADERDLLYFTDTRGGSSGSPVCLDDWTVVGLHRGTKKIDEVEFQGGRTRFVNVGTQMSAVLDHLREHRPGVYEEIMTAQRGLPAPG
ncbi:trypsin-like peptidase domain-containing protein [Streptomyces sp.]|uniref:trypsin-like peptidase domain-containing protein n=1 Tax=Streptomyces sp. TaxID=1931 RepID=UPI0028117C36|nr:trypsin-like peptidase domain-containing protein [Streptomyces sp.]